MSAQARSEPARTKPRAARAGPWGIVVGSLLALATSSGAVMTFTFSLFIAPLADEFRWSHATVSLGFTTMTLALALSAPWVGRVIDRRGVRSTLLVALPLFALSLGALAAIPSTLSVFLLVFAVAGLLGALHSPIPYVKLISQWFDTRRGFALGIAMTGIGVGGLLLGQLVRSLIEHYGWRAGFLGLGGCVIAVGWPAVLLLLRNPLPHHAPETGSATAVVTGFTVREALSDLRFAAIAGMVFCLTMALNGVAAHAVPILQSKGIARHEAASMLGVLALASLLGRLATGALLDRVFAPRVAVLTGLTVLSGLALLTWGTGPAAAIAALACVGLALGAEIDLMGYLIGRYFGLRHFAQLMGVLFGVFSIASAISVLMMGASHDLHGSYGGALLALAAGVLLGTACVSRLGSYRFAAALTP